MHSSDSPGSQLQLDLQITRDRRETYRSAGAVPSAGAPQSQKRDLPEWWHSVQRWGTSISATVCVCVCVDLSHTHIDIHTHTHRDYTTPSVSLFFSLSHTIIFNNT